MKAAPSLRTPNYGQQPNRSPLSPLPLTIRAIRVIRGKKAVAVAVTFPRFPFDMLRASRDFRGEKSRASPGSRLRPADYVVVYNSP